MFENEILDQAVETAKKVAGLEIEVLQRGYIGRGKQKIDALIGIPGRNIQLVVEVKTWAKNANIGAITQQIRQLKITQKEEAILVADYINPNMGEKLRDAKVQYVDVAGNAYINQNPLYIYIKGQKELLNKIAKTTAKTGIAFKLTGLKVVYEFLRDGELINAPYREIAEKAQVALGNIGLVFNDLINQGYIREGMHKNDKRELVNREELVSKWVEEYPYKLKKKMRIGTFTTENPNWWKGIDPTLTGALWGGEIAAAKYTKYLTPEVAEVYIDKYKLVEFLNTARLRKRDPNIKAGTRIEIIEKFWKEDDRELELGLVNPMIAYADLIETGDPRNLEVADRLREEFID